MSVARVLLLLASCVPDGAAPIYTSLVQGGIGSACGQDSDCQNAHCFTDGNWLGFNVATFGGFCSRACSSDSECGSGFCLSGNDGNNYCVPPCDQPSHCRDDYLCNPDAHNHCEPVSLFTLDCDPSLPVCTTGSGATGGCLRAGLGGGTVGFCLTACFFGAGCAAGEACHYVDDAVEHGAYQGALCIPVSGALTPIGGACTATIQCASDSNCVNGLLGVACNQLCDTANPCLDGADCKNFDPPGPIGICQF